MKKKVKEEVIFDYKKKGFKVLLLSFFMIIFIVLMKVIESQQVDTLFLMNNYVMNYN